MQTAAVLRCFSCNTFCLGWAIRMGGQYVRMNGWVRDTHFHAGLQVKTLQRQHDSSARYRAADPAPAAPTVLPDPAQRHADRQLASRLHAAPQAAGRTSAADCGAQPRPASPRTVRQRLEFGADTGHQSGGNGYEREQLTRADAWTAARAAHAPTANAAVSVTPITGTAHSTDSFSLRQPADADAAESPTQLKLRSLMKVSTKSSHSVTVLCTCTVHNVMSARHVLVTKGKRPRRTPLLPVT